MRYNMFLNSFRKGVEIDCVQEMSDKVRFIEIKSSATLSDNHIKNLLLLKKLFLKTEDYVVYTGQETPLYHNVQFVNWQNVEQII